MANNTVQSSINTKEFQTKSMIQDRNNAGLKNHWVVALDIGYSAVKGMSKNAVFSFPSFATKTRPGAVMIGKAKPTDIQYKDENGVIWDVGDSAISFLSPNDSTSEEALYGRNRYQDPMFLVLARVGIALGMQKNNYGSPDNKKFVLQTGLPPKFLKSDTPILRRVLSGHHLYYVKTGNSDWIKYEFTLNADDINVMSQPMGSFFSASFNDDGSDTADINELFYDDLLLFDGGFGTLDTFEIKKRRIDTMQTFDNLGMKAVFERVKEDLQNKYHIETSIPALQNVLGDGFIKQYIPEENRTQKIFIANILEEANKTVCMEAINQMKTLYNNLIDCKYLLITGGTGEAWIDIMKDYFKGMEDLKIISANRNSNLSQIFSNVRGYYLYQLGKILRGK